MTVTVRAISAQFAGCDGRLTQRTWLLLRINRDVIRVHESNSLMPSRRPLILHWTRKLTVFQTH